MCTCVWVCAAWGRCLLLPFPQRECMESPEESLAKAERALTKFGLFNGTSKREEACVLFNKAAQAFKVNKQCECGVSSLMRRVRGTWHRDVASVRAVAPLSLRVTVLACTRGASRGGVRPRVHPPRANSA